MRLIPKHQNTNFNWTEISRNLQQWGDNDLKQQQTQQSSSIPNNRQKQEEKFEHRARSKADVAAERAVKQRQERASQGTYDAKKSKEWTHQQVVKSSQEQDAVDKALNIVADISSGIGMGADAVSMSMGGPPVYSALKAAKSFSKAIDNSENRFGNIVEGTLWSLPMIGGVAKETTPMVKSAVVEPLSTAFENSFNKFLAWKNGFGDPVIPTSKAPTELIPKTSTYTPSETNAITISWKDANRPTISLAEKAGIPKGERNSPSPYKQIGTIQEPKSRLEDYTITEGQQFGKNISRGSEQQVFENTKNRNKVLKVYFGEKFTTIPEIKEFHKRWMKRNQLPIQERMKFVGYVSGNNRIYPVYEQNKINVIGKIGYSDFEQQYLPQIDRELSKLGYSGRGTYTNGRLTVGDISPFNIGYNNNGELRFIDVDVYIKGGLLNRS